jgi:hypothetical protein
MRKLKPRIVQRPALQSVRCQCGITTLLYNNTLKEKSPYLSTKAYRGYQKTYHDAPRVTGERGSPQR